MPATTSIFCILSTNVCSRWGCSAPKPSCHSARYSAVRFPFRPVRLKRIYSNTCQARFAFCEPGLRFDCIYTLCIEHPGCLLTQRCRCEKWGKNLRGVIINLYLCDVERCGLPTLSGCGIYRKETIATDKKKEQICHDIQFSHSVG